MDSLTVASSSPFGAFMIGHGYTIIGIALQAIILGVLIKYTYETFQLRSASEIANEYSVKPFLITGRAWHFTGAGSNRAEFMSIINGGNGPALNIRIFRWVHSHNVRKLTLRKPHIISIMPKGDSYRLDNRIIEYEFDFDFENMPDGQIIKERIDYADSLNDYIVELILYYDVNGNLHESLSTGPEEGINQTQFKKLKCGPTGTRSPLSSIMSRIKKSDEDLR